MGGLGGFVKYNIWCAIDKFQNMGVHDARYIAAANPQAILKLCAVVRAAKAVGYSNGFDAAYPDKLEALRTALSDIGAKE